MHRYALVALLAGATLLPFAAHATIDTDLALGSRGPQVSELQGFLKEQGLFSAATSTRFGPLTKSAVIAFQKREGISPASGRVGPLTRTRVESIRTALSKPSIIAKSATSTPAKTATTTAIKTATTTANLATSRSSTATNTSTTTPFLERLSYIARKDFQDNLNLAILSRLQAIFDKQQDVLRSFQNICTGSCYTQLASADASLSSTIAEVRNAINNERYAIATLNSHRERLILAYTRNELSASTSTTKFSAASTERAAPLGRINEDAGSYERLVSLDTYLNRARNIQSKTSTLIRSYSLPESAKTISNSIGTLLNTVAKDTTVATTTKVSTIICSVDTNNIEFRTSCALPHP